jgi:hypothetical protein
MGGDYGNQISRARGCEHRNAHLRRVARLCAKSTSCGIAEQTNVGDGHRLKWLNDKQRNERQFGIDGFPKLCGLDQFGRRSRRDGFPKFHGNRWFDVE